MYPNEHLGHHYGPAPTNKELGITLPSEEIIAPDGSYCEECD
jgi:hypothetical protein